MAKSSRELLITLGADTTSFSQKIKRSKDLIKELDSNFKLASSSSAEFEKSVEGLSKKQDYLSDRLKVANATSKAYIDKMKETKDVLDNVSKNHAKYTHELQSMESALKNAKQGTLFYEELSKSVEEVRKKHQQATKDVKSYTDRLIGLRKGYDDNQAGIQQMNKELARTGELMSNMSHNAKFEEMNAELMEAEREFENIRKSTENFGSTMKHLTTEQEFYQNQVKKTNEIMEAYNKDITNSTKKIDELEVTIRNLNKEVAEHEKLLSGMDENDAMFGHYSEELEKYRSDLTIATTVLEEHKNKVKEMEQAYKKSENSLASYTNKIHKVRAEMKKMSESVQIEKTQEKSAFFNDFKIEKLTSDLHQLRNDFIAITSGANSFENSMEGLQFRMDSYNEMLTIANRASRAYKEQIDVLTTDQQRLQTELTQTNLDLIKYEEILKTANRNNGDWDRTTEKINALNLKHKELTASLTETTAKLKESQQGLNGIEKESMGLVNSIDKVDVKMKEMKNSVDFKPIIREVKTLAEQGIEKLENKTEQLGEALKTIDSNIDGVDNSLSGLAGKLSILTSQFEKQTELVNLYDKELVQTSALVTTLSERSEHLTRELISMQKTLNSNELKGKAWDELNTKFKTTEEEYKKLNASLDTHMAKEKELQGQLKNSKSSLSQINGEITKTRNKINELNGKGTFDHIERSLESLSSEFELLGSKMELLKSKFISFETSFIGARKESKLLKEQTKVLREEFQQQQSAMKLYQENINNLAIKHDELTRKIRETKMSLVGMDRESPKFAETIVAIGNMEIELEKVEKEIDEVTASLRRMETESNHTMTNINNNIQAQGRGWEVMSNKIKGVGDSFVNIGNKMQSAGAFLQPLTLGVSALGAGIIKTGMDFEAQISRLGALTGEKGAKLKKTMAQLEKGARDLGATTQYSASQSAKGLEDFMLAGYDATDAIKAMPIAVQMATADNIELNEATELLTTSLSSLGNNSELTGNQVKDLGILANQMAVNAVATTTDMAGLARSFVKVGGQAENLHIPLSTTGTLLGILGDKGVVAEEAGNALNSILINLTQESGQSADGMKKLGLSAFDAKGKIKPMEQLLGELKKKLKGLSTEKQEILIKNLLGGKVQAKTLMKLLQGIDEKTGQFTDKYKNLKKELENAPKTDALGEMYRKSKDNLKGDIFTLKSTVEESFISIYKSIDKPLREIVQKTTEVVRQLTEKWKALPESTQRAIVKFTALSALLAPLLSIFGYFTAGIGHTIKTFGSLVGVSGKVVTKFNLLKEGGFKLSSLLPSISGATEGVAGGLGGLAGASEGAVGAFAGLSAIAIPALVVAFGAIVTAIGNNESMLGTLQDKWGAFGTFVGGLCEHLAGWIGLAFGNALTLLGTLGEAFVKFISGDWKNIDDVISQGWHRIENNTKKSWSNITMESTRAISTIRELSSKDLAGVKDVFEKTFNTIKNVTTENVNEVGNKLGDMFKSTDGKMLNLSQQTLTTIRGTSDAMALLFDGINANMKIDEAKERFKTNLNDMVKSGDYTTSELAKDFSEAEKIINQNMVDGLGQTMSNAKSILSEFGEMASGNIKGGVDDIVTAVSELDTRTVETLRNLGTNWKTILGDIKTDGSQSTEQMKEAILRNIERLGLDTPEKMAEFKKALESELQTATESGKEKGFKLGLGVNEGTQEGLEEGKEETKEKGKEVVESAGEGAQDVTDAVASLFKDTGENMGKSTNEGFTQSMQTLPDNIRNELAKAGVTINEQGQVITEDMGKKGADAGNAYVTTLQNELPKLTGVSQNIQNQLAGIDSVRLGNVTKQLSEVNRWLGVVTGTSVNTRVHLVALTNLPFGNTTHGLSEINQWLMRTQNRARDTRQPMLNLTNLPFGNTTHGLSEVNNWLMRTRNRANDTAGALRNVAGVRFGGVTSGLSQICNWLDSVRRKSQSASNAISSVSSARTGSYAVEKDIAVAKEVPQLQAPQSSIYGNLTTTPFTTGAGLLDSLFTTSFSISKYQTSGGYYEPKQMTSGNTGSSDSDLKELLQATLNQNQLLMNLLQQSRPIEVGVNVDGRQIAKASAKYMETEMNSLSARKNRLGGIF